MDLFIKHLGEEENELVPKMLAQMSGRCTEGEGAREASRHPPAITVLGWKINLRQLHTSQLRH